MSERKRYRKVVQFACLASEEMGPENEDIPAIEVNLAIRFVNLANITGAGNWEIKNCAEEFPIVIDTGFGGLGFLSYAWLGEYAECFGEFLP